MPRGARTDDFIDVSDKRLVAWLAELPPRQELVVRMALNGKAKSLVPNWDRRLKR
jgi:hypothetical protein